jgi:hypothetical protein
MRVIDSLVGANPTTRSMKISVDDYKFVPVDPSPDFSEERNKRIIKEVIEETDKIAEKKRREFKAGIDERIEAVTRFLEKAKQGATNSDVKGYFGKKMLSYLSGKDARQLDQLTVIDRQGNTIHGPQQ